MKDMLTTIGEAMKKNSTISELCEDRVKPFVQEDTAKLNKSVTVIPLTPPTAGTYASNKSLTSQHTYQINVEAEDREICKEIAVAAKEVMTALGFMQQAGGLDGYFPETKRFVDARKYTGNTNLYDTDY